MMTSWKITLVVTLVGMLSIAVEEARVDAARTKVEQAALATANAVAQRDSTRDVSLESARVAHVAGDSLRIMEKRVVQVKQGRDALDQALAREKKAQYALSARVESLFTVRAAPTEDGAGGTRTAAFHVRDAPYTVDADVTLRSPPDSGALQLRIALDTVPMRLRITCDRSAGELAGQPSIVVETPRWVRVALGDVSQGPDVCASGRKQAARMPIRLRLRPVLGIGRVLAAERSTWGAFVGIGLTM